MKAKEQIQLQIVKDNYVNQTVDSLVGIPCFCCPEINKCNPNNCQKLEMFN
jgi:hypothetical protein